ncbi:MAG: VOC family protein [Marinicellaceae bacterium]
MQKITPFHLAIPVDCLLKARDFYGKLLGCEEGRSSTDWIDYNFFGHQLVCHCSGQSKSNHQNNAVDGKNVPVPHFGVVLEMSDWLELKDKLMKNDTAFLIEPYVRFEGLDGEQATMFLYDLSGNALEFKSFKNISSELFKK